MNTPLRNEQRVAILFLLSLPILLTLLQWEQLPAEIPIHWNWRGEVDRYASKLHFLLYEAGLGAFIFFAFDVLPRLDPKRANYERFGRAYGVMAVAIAGFLSFVGLLSLAVALGYEVSMERIVPVGVSLLLAIIGNNLINVKPNYFVGIRTPWTLESEYVWRKTHRLGGQLWFYGGLLLALLCLFLASGGALLVLLVGVAVLAGVSPGFSYWLYHQNEGKDLV